MESAEIRRRAKAERSKTAWKRIEYIKNKLGLSNAEFKDHKTGFGSLLKCQSNSFFSIVREKGIPLAQVRSFSEYVEIPYHLFFSEESGDARSFEYAAKQYIKRRSLKCMDLPAYSHHIWHDRENNLVWQKTESEEMDWEKAIDAATRFYLMGKARWRLPTIQELASLIDYSKFAPAADINVFPDIKQKQYWSSTESANDKKVSWVVNFKNGSVSVANKKHKQYVRYVLDVKY